MNAGEEKMKVYKKLFSYVPKMKYYGWLATLFSDFSVVLTVYGYYSIYKFLKSLIIVGDEYLAKSYAVQTVAWLTLGALFYIFSGLFSHILGFRLETNLRKKGISGLTEASFRFFDLNSSGYIRKTIDDNAAKTHMAIAHLIPDSAQAIVTPVLSVALGFFINFKIGLVLIAMLVIGVFLLKKMTENTNFIQKYQESLDVLSSETVEYIRGIQVIKIFGAKVTSFKALNKAINDYAKFAYKYSLSGKTPFVLFQWLFFGIVCILIVPITFFITSLTTPKILAVDLLMLFFLSGIIFVSFMRIMYVSMHLFEARYAVETLDSLYLEMKQDQLKYGNETQIKNCDIAFENVSFSYKEECVLENFNLVLEQKRIYALVGKSGSGKSTIAKLISGFYNVDKGQIKIGGKPLNHYSKDTIINTIAFVFQDTKLFNQSIYDNVSIANPQAPASKVFDALRLAGCESILEKFPEREHTLIGSKGVYLSGGEKQRIAIARAILKDAKIVIMDEASASIDPDNEYELQKAFQHLMKEKNKFALTNQGAEDLVKASISSFFVYCINMVPAFIIMMLIDELVLENVKPPWLYFTVSFVTLLFMYWLLDREYENLYNSTYKESAHLRMQIADDLSNLPLSYFSKHNLSDLSQTIMSDVEGIEHAMSHAIPKAGGMALFFPFISVMLLVGNVKMGLAVILPTLFSFVLILLSKKSQTKANTKYYDTLRENSEEFQETIELQQEINSFNLSKKVQDRLFKKMEESERIHLKVELSTFSVMALSSIFSYVSLAVVILVGVHLLLTGEVTILYVVGYLLAAIKIKDSFDSMKEAVLEIFYLAPKIQRIRAMKETSIQEGSDSPLKSFDIELRDVSFSYDNNTPILDHISFTAKQGEVTALVGASGSGKTSILKLVSRLYDYDEGCILIDGYDIKRVSPASLFSKIAIVFQEVTLFNTSILENIRIGNSQASDEEVKKAARLANCEDFIEKLPDGYHTLVGENGSSLSGGERQRLSIARAFLKNAPILILDEITASLDAENEKRIQESLNRLIQDKTVLIISHRLKSIEKVNKIVVMDQGKIVDQGTHSELYRRSEIYKNLIKKTKLSEKFVYEKEAQSR
ncbi:hypothetical protein B1P86_13615 [Enterococcus faecium]|nr:hypothetical protein B1P86_13615 [Enterococcus faecium]